MPPASKTEQIVFEDLDGTPAADQYLNAGDDETLEVVTDLGDQQDAPPASTVERREAPAEGKADDDEDIEVVAGEPESAEDEEKPAELRPGIDPDLAVYDEAAQDAIMASRRERAVAVAERDRIAQENQQLEFGRRQAEHQGLKAAKSSLGASIEETKRQMIAAQEEGETAKAADLQVELSTLTHRFNEVDSALERTPEPELPDPNETAQPAVQLPPDVKRLQEQWVAANPWFTGESHEDARLQTFGLDNQMSREGKNPADPAYWDELAERINKSHPGLAKGLSPQPPAKKPAPRPPVAAPDRGTAAGARPKNRVVLTRDDHAKMENFGLDPSNPAHVNAFARERLATLQREQAQR